MRYWTLGLLLSLACGPSKEKRDTEARAYAAMLDNALDVGRRWHTCDDRKEALDAAFVGREMKSIDAARDRWEACLAALPSDDEVGAKSRRLNDEWLDACLECAAPRACIASLRTRRDDHLALFRLKGDALEKEKIRLEEMKSAPVCAPAR